MLFIHGLGGSRAIWSRQVQATLAATHHLVKVDLREHGDADKPDSVAACDDPALWAGDIAAAIDAAGLKRLAASSQPLSPTLFERSQEQRAGREGGNGRSDYNRKLDLACVRMLFANDPREKKVGRRHGNGRAGYDSGRIWRCAEANDADGLGMWARSASACG